jgi:hypothetical protein
MQSTPMAAIQTKGVVALITEPAHPGLRQDDEHLAAPLRALGIDLEPVPWGSALDPERHALALLRTPWDYFHRVDEFLAWCEAAPVPLHNPAPLVRWNAHKRYLLELERRGAARISPTAILARGASEPRVAELVDALHGRTSDDPLRRLVLKPAVSGGAHETYVLDPAAADADERLARATERSDVIVQRFERRLVDEGEWSLVFFDGVFSHALLKRPRRGDFRVQVEHGGSATPAVARPKHVADAARLLRLAAPEPPLYARVDGFEAPDGGFVLVELELIEPELFLRFGGAESLARGIAARIARSQR